MKVEHQTRQHMQIVVMSSHIDFNAVDMNSAEVTLNSTLVLQISAGLCEITFPNRH